MGRLEMPSIEVAPTTLRLVLLIYGFQKKHVCSFSTLERLIFPVPAAKENTFHPVTLNVTHDLDLQT